MPTTAQLNGKPDNHNRSNSTPYNCIDEGAQNLPIFARVFQLSEITDKITGKKK